MRGERLPGDDALPVGEEAAREAGDERRDREAEHLHEDHVHADPRRRTFVGPDREHRGAERARPQPRHTERDDDEQDQAEEAELPARERVAHTDAEIPAEELRLFHGVAERLDGWMPNMPVLRNQIVSIPADRARVTTPSVRPRKRSAGSPITTPTTAAAVAAISGANGNGTPQSNDR